MSVLEYPFTDLAIDIDGAHVGAFTGIAFLVPDAGGFWVSGIVLTEPDEVQLLRSGSTLARELVMAIETELYASPHARDAWAAHVEEEQLMQRDEVDRLTFALSDARMEIATLRKALEDVLSEYHGPSGFRLQQLHAAMKAAKAALEKAKQP